MRRPKTLRTAVRRKAPVRRSTVTLLLERLERREVPAVVTWIGPTTGGNFADAADWSTKAVPGALDDAVIPAGDTVASSANETVNSLTATNFQITGGTFTINAVGTPSMLTDLTVNNGAELSVTGGNSPVDILGSTISGTLNVAGSGALQFESGTNNLDTGAALTGTGQFVIGVSGSQPTVSINGGLINAPTDLVLASGTIDGAGTLTIPSGATLHWVSTDASTMSGSGATDVAAGGTMLIGGTGTDTLDRTINNLGTISLDGGTGLDLASTLNNLAGGKLNINSNVNVTGNGTIANAGTITKSGTAGATTFDVVLNNTGTVNVNTGTLTLAGGGTESGTVNVPTGATLVFNSPTVPIIISTGATFTGTGTVSLTGGALNVNAPVTISGFNLSGGTLGGTGTLTLTGTPTITGGTMTGTGTTLVAQGATLTIDGTDVAVSGGRQFNVAGTLNVPGPGTLNVSGAGTSLVILPTGIFNLSGGVGLGTDTAATITNEGTFIKTNGVSTITQPFTNTGTLEVNSGTLAFPGGLTETAGTTTVATGATLVGNLTQTGGTTTLATGATLQGDVALNGGILAGNGTVNGNVTGAGAIGSTTTPGVLTINGNVDLSGPLNAVLTGINAGTQFSQLAVNGNLTLSGPLNLSNKFGATVGSQFTIINNTGTAPITGTFAGLSEGSTISSGGQNFTISFMGGPNHNSVVLTAASAPVLPTSSANSLPTNSPPTFTVSWSGSDVGGPGIATFSVFVSDNGGAFTPFVTDTAQTSAVFHGVVGHTYGFFSVATDVNGNVQPTPTSAQATTTVVATTMTGMHVVGPGPGSPPLIQVYNPDGSVKLSFMAYASNFFGGVHVALADVNGDGTPDIISGAGAGGGPHVKVFSGVDGSLLDSFMAYNVAFTGGVNVGAADINGDGKADIITGAGPGGGPHVKVWNAATATAGVPTVMASFFAYAPQFMGGVFVAGGDVSGDGIADVITGAGPGGGPHVKVFNGADLAAGGTTAIDAVNTPVDSFFAYDSNFAGGVFVAAGDVNGDGRADIITGAGAGGTSNVKVFNAVDLSTLRSFNAFNPVFLGGVDVATADVNGDDIADIVTGAGPGGGPQVKVFSGADGSVLENFYALPTAFTGGVFVG
jgi:hypothetical protein